MGYDKYSLLLQVTQAAPALSPGSDLFSALLWSTAPPLIGILSVSLRLLNFLSPSRGRHVTRTSQRMLVNGCPPWLGQGCAWALNLDISTFPGASGKRHVFSLGHCQLVKVKVVSVSSVQFSSVAQSCPTLCDLMDCSMPGFPILHHLLEFSPMCLLSP